MKYHTITDNIKFPTFHNNALLDILMKPVTSLSIIDQLNSFYNVVIQLENMYSKILEVDLHEISKRLLDNNRGANYYLAALEGLKRIFIILADKIKIQFNIVDSQIENYQLKEKVTILSSIINNNESIILKELLEFQSTKENKIQSSQKRVGLCLINSTLIYGKFVLENIIEQIIKLKQITVYNGSSSELILMNLILHVSNIYYPSIVV